MLRNPFSGPKKPANSSPLSLSPLVSPPRTWLAARQPAEVLHVTRQPAELVTADVTGL